MKLIKVLTSWTLVFALATLQIQGTTIVLNSTFAQAEVPADENGGEPPAPEPESASTTPTPAATAAPSLDYRASHNDSPSLSINQIMVLFVLLTGPTVGYACFSQVSGKIFAATALIYLIMELANYKKFKDASTSNQEMYAELDGKTEDTQITAFTHAEQQELTAADALATKKKNTQILATGLTAASIASLVEAIIATSSFTACVTASVGTGTCACGPAASLIESCASPCATAGTCSGPAGTMACSSVSSIQKIKPSLFEQIQMYAMGTPSAAESDLSIDGMMDSHSVDFSQEFKSIFKKLSGILISSAKADEPASGGVLSGLGISAVIIGIILANTSLMSAPLIIKLGSGYVRSAYFAVLAAFAWAAVNEIGDGEQELRDNAKVYETLRDRLMQALNSKSRFAGINGPQNAFKNRLAAYAAIRDEMNSPPDGAICLTGNQGERRVDEQCQCRKTNTCAKVDFSGVDFKGQGVPSFFGSTLGGLQTGANSLFAGNFAGANSAFGTIGTNAANIRKLSKQMKDKTKGMLKKTKGFEKFDLDKIEKQTEAQAKKAATRLLDKFSKTNGNMLAALGAGSGTGVKPLEKDISKIDTAQLLASIEQAAKEEPKAADPFAGFKFDFGEEEEKAAETKQVALSQGDALGDFVTNESDISDRPDENIFKIITVRYFKSAYPRIFQEDKKQSLE